MEQQNLLSSGQKIASNEGLLSKILVGLPVRHLVSSRRTSRFWRVFISNPEFAREHTRNLANENPNFLLRPTTIYFFYSRAVENSKLDAVSLSDTNVVVPPISYMEEVAFRTRSSKFEVLMSCNGLLLCSTTTTTNEFSMFGQFKLIVVVNPIMQSHYALPTPFADMNEMELVLSYHLVYDPSMSPYYKVICIKKARQGLLRRSEREISIYSSENKLWRKSSCRFNEPRSMYLNSGLFWNGAMNWIGKNYSLHFDASLETMTRRQMPPKPRGLFDKKTRYFGEWGGHLHLIQVKNLETIKFNVLELDTTTYRWFVKYRVHLVHILRVFPEVAMKRANMNCWKWYNFNILAVVRGEKDEDSELVIAIPGKIISFNFISKRVKLLLDMPEKANEELHIGCYSSFPYVETLLHVKN